MGSWLEARGQTEVVVAAMTAVAVAAAMAFGAGLGPMTVAPVALVGLCAAGVVWWHRQLTHLPLRLSRVVLVAPDATGAWFRCRVILGHGRRMGSAEIDVVARDAAGQERPLDVLRLGPGPWVGPVEIAARDRDGTSAGSEDIVVRVSAREGDHTWHVERSWPRATARRGRFAPPLECRRGAVAWRFADWERWEAAPAQLEDRNPAKP